MGVDRKFIGMMEKVHRSRPKTLCHGDLNAGNTWVRKTNRDEILMTDWQNLGMAPIGFDFGLMLIVLPSGPTFEEKSAMMKNYHDKLPQHIRDEYSLSQLEDDFRCQIAFYMTNVCLVMAGQMDPAVMTPEKFKFTWETYWAGMYRRFLGFYHDEKIQDLCNQLIDGSYTNFVEPPLCIHNVFYTSPDLCKTQQYCKNPDEITNEWLSCTLNAQVTSFEKILCAQGQLGLTVVLKNIQYAAGTVDRPASLALKMHTQAEQVLPIIQLLNSYSRELYY